ncbi:MAG: nucleotidyltransferase domain-containing protein [Candidatus Helarchaeota archaeon]
MLFLYKDDILKRISEEYPKLDDGVVTIILFGSVARDEYTPMSDIDLLIITTDRPRTSKLFSKYLEPIYSETSVVISPKYLMPDEFKSTLDPLYKIIKREGKVLWKRKMN